MAVVCAAVFCFHFYRRVDERLRAHIETLLAEQYPGLEVKVKFARLIEREGFRIGGVSFVENVADSAPRDLAYIDEILVRCNPKLDDLLRGRVEVTEIIVRHPTVRSIRYADGSWSIQHFAKLPCFGGCSRPNIFVDDATLEILDTSRRPNGLFTLRDIQCRLSLEASGTAAGAPPRMQIEGTFTGDHLQRTVVKAVIDPPSGVWRVTGEVAGLMISPALATAVPIEIAEQLEMFGELQAHCEFKFDVTNARADRLGDTKESLARSADPRGPIQFTLSGKMADGRLSDPALSFPLTDVSATFSCDNQNLRVENIRGRFGEAVVNMSCRRDGTNRETPFVVDGKIDNLRLDRSLVANLPESWQQVWDKFRPQGQASAEFQILRQNGRWNSDFRIHFHDVGLTWARFPYRVEMTSGLVRIRPARVDFDLHSKNPRQPLQLRGELQRSATEQWYGWFEALTDQPMPLDERFISAMSAETQRVVRSFSPHGLMTLYFRSTRKEHEPESKVHLDINISEANVRHEKFPYPLHSVSGRIERRNNEWTFRDFVGTNDRGQFAWQGTYDQRDGGMLRLRLVGIDVPLEQELRDALSPPVQAAWNTLQPQGALDHVTADLQIDRRTKQTNLRVTIEERDSDNADRANSLSIRHEQFPFRIDRITGVATCENGHVRFHNLRGRHEGVRMAADGSAAIRADRSWALNFDQLTIDRLKADSEFTKALPPALRSLLTRMQLDGVLWLDGALALEGRHDDPASLQASWRMLVDVENASMVLGSQLDHVSGQVTLTGNAHGGDFGCRGELEIDSLMVNGTQLTSLRGPIWIDPSRVLAGARVGNATPEAERRSLESKVFGGTLLTDFQSLSDEEGQFEIRCRLQDADVSQIDRQRARGPVPIRGRAWADVQLTGNRQGRHALRGSGSVQLRDTNLYELPFFLMLFKSMRTGSTDRTAFTSSDAEFRVQGDHIYFDSLDLKGDTLTMKGVGEMSLDRDIKLDFYSVVGREDAYFPALRPLLGIASRRFLVVKVTGTIDDPQMSREVLPDINDTLRRLFPETESTGSASVVRRNPNTSVRNAIRQTGGPSSAK